MTQNKFNLKFVFTILILCVAGCLTSLGKVWGFICIYHASYLRMFDVTIDSSKMNFLTVIMLASEVVGMACFTFIRVNLGYHKGLVLSLVLCGMAFM